MTILSQLVIMNPRQTLFISDLHLCENQPHLTAAFDRLLSNFHTEIDALYILGDFFNAWIGDDNHNPFIDHIQNQLKQYTASGIPTYFMVGNRDFMVGKRFAKHTGVALISDPTCITLYGQKTLLLHGDSLCTDDKQHQRTRRLMHSRLCQGAIRALPLSLRQYCANRFRQISQQRQRTLDRTITDVTPSAVDKAMDEAGVTLMIHGHTHRPAQHHWTDSAGQHKQRIVLGQWGETSTFLIARPGPGGPLLTLTDI